MEVRTEYEDWANEVISKRQAVPQGEWDEVFHFSADDKRAFDRKADAWLRKRGVKVMTFRDMCHAEVSECKAPTNEV
jgi:hypothetical protein